MPVATTVSGSGGVLTDEQAAQYLRDAGFPESEIAKGVAIGIAESGLRTNAHNGNTSTGDNSYGVWQINMLGGMGTERRKQFGISNNEALFNPATNAKAAYSIWRSAGQSWRPWSTNGGAAYQRALKRLLEKWGGGIPGSQSEGFTSGDQRVGFLGGDPLGIRTGIHEFTESVRKSLWLMLIIIVAIVLFIMGFIILNRDKMRKLTSLIPAGKVAKVLR